MEDRGNHLDVTTTDLFWVGGVLYWRIHLTNGFSCEVSDGELRKWLMSHGERFDSRKISYRKMARYAHHIQENSCLNSQRSST